MRTVLWAVSSAGYNTTGSQNSFLGTNAGANIITGSYNTMLGYNTQPTSGTLQNAVTIGAYATVARSNAIILGNPGNTSMAVGIGTNNLQFPLDVRGIIRLQNSGTIKFTHLLNPHLRNGTTDQFLTVNEQGEIVLARHRLRIEDVAQWSDRVFAKGYVLRPLSWVAQYLGEHGHLPNVPSAIEVVEVGVDLVTLNATLLEKIEELTLYSIQQEKDAQAEKQKKASFGRRLMS
ncbi:hypothetical protein IC229_27990 [Spirosoma sp. BT702]|uniref:Peptidase S74 domain-containing protein n=1 Tax=Spirosoma profusum TaxID=2771354 RepID=A0A926Y0U1_9BACT|nr:hypothetical protein [Spirosoma profusum]MBD2704514.1 hypothetical protein [Spirosoma profusum]